LPDQTALPTKNAGLGVLIINTQVHPSQNIYIKASMTDSTSVLMAEAAAMALGAAVTDRLQLHHTNFLSDSQELVSFFNANDHSNPPDWRIKYLTQHFIDYTQYRSTSTFKITRSQNQTADSLARQALLDMRSLPPNVSSVCSNTNHVNRCPVQDALQSVTVDSVTVLTARCC